MDFCHAVLVKRTHHIHVSGKIFILWECFLKLAVSNYQDIVLCYPLMVSWLVSSSYRYLDLFIRHSYNKQWIERKTLIILLLRFHRKQSVPLFSIRNLPVHITSLKYQKTRTSYFLLKNSAISFSLTRRATKFLGTSSLQTLIHSLPNKKFSSVAWTMKNPFQTMMITLLRAESKLEEEKRSLILQHWTRESGSRRARWNQETKSHSAEPSGSTRMCISILMTTNCWLLHRGLARLQLQKAGMQTEGRVSLRGARQPALTASLCLPACWGLQHCSSASCWERLQASFWSCSKTCEVWIFNYEHMMLVDSDDADFGLALMFLY